MAKTILKEVIIILMLCLAILLVLSVLFYDYNPISKVVPNKIAYTTPEEIKEDLQEENVVEEITVENIVYTVEGSDLNIYKKSKSYVPGKANPFATTVVDEEVTDDAGKDSNVNKQTAGNAPTQEENLANKNTTDNNNETTFWNETGSK